MIADDAGGEEPGGPDLQEALRECLRGLGDADRGLVHERYTEGRTVREIAVRHKRSEGAMQQVYFRIRNALRICIDRRVAREGGAP